MSKNTLIQYLITKGKTHRWDELARMHGLRSADAARSAWNRYRSLKDDEKETSTKPEPEFETKTFITKGGDNIHMKVETESSKQDQANYIAELEDKVVKLVEQMKTLPKTAAFSIGYNPLDYSLEMQKDFFLAEMRKNSIRQRTMRVENNTNKDNLLELSIFDLHIGKLAWDKETGEDYDIEIAIKRYKDSITGLLSRVNLSTIERILLPIGNDMVNVDGKSNTTTAGTPQSCDSRFGKMFRAAKELIISTVDELTAIAPVDIMIIPGNHDEVTMFTIGEVLDAWYHNNEDVNVFNSPKLRKYYQYGQNMIMFTHGDKEKHQDLGLIAATEQAKMWAETKYREVHTGHLHKTKAINYMSVDEFQGFKIRILPSLSGTDAWHHSKGYMSLKAAEAYVWNKEQGMISNHFYNL